MQELLQYLLYLVGVVAAAGVLMAGARNVRAGFAILTVMVLFSAMSTQSEQGKELFAGRTWLHAIQANRANLYMGAAILLALVLLMHTRLIQMQRVAGAAVIMLVINLYAGVLDIRHDPLGGAQRVGLAMLAIGSLALFVTASLRTWDDYLTLMRALGAVGALWIGGAMVQAVLDQSQMLMGWQKRFVGLLGNPQGTAVYVGPQSAIMLWLALNDPVKKMRVLWSCLFAVMLMMVVWTGSRTAALLTLTGAMFLLRARLGGAVFLLPILAAALVGVSYIVSSLGIQLPFDRLIAGGDTRSAAWSGLFEDALATGLIGEGWTGARFVENAYLLGWVVYGQLMLLLMLAQLLFMGVNAARIWGVRRETPQSIRRLIDLIIAYYAMYFLGAQFEWYIVSRIDANICFITIFSCMGVCIYQTVLQQRQLGEEFGHEPEAWQSPATEYADYGADDRAAT